MKWIVPTLQGMEALPWEDDDWVTDGKRTQPAAARELLRVLFKVLDSQCPPPAVVPTWRGGVQAEWHRNNVDLEIEADPESGVEYFFKSPAEECEGQTWEELDRLAQYALAIV